MCQIPFDTEWRSGCYLRLFYRRILILSRGGKTGLCFTKEQTTNNAHILKLTNVYLNFNKIYMNFFFYII